MSKFFRMKSVFTLIVLVGSVAFTSRFANAESKTSVNVQASAGTYYDQRTDLDDAIGSGPVSASVTVNLVDSDRTVPGSGSATATAYADFGVLKVSSYSGGTGSGAGTSGARASFSDTFSVHVPGSAGQTGMLTTTLNFFWTGSLVGTSGLPVQLNVDLVMNGGNGLVGAGTSANLEESVSYLSISQGGGEIVDLPFSWTVQVSREVIFGADIEFVFILQAGTQAQGSYDLDGKEISSSSTLIASNSAYWGGLTLSDSLGSPINTFTVVSESGTDWKTSFVAEVPEPRTWMLFALGLIWISYRNAVKRF